MKGNFVNFLLFIALLILTFIPWPGPLIFKISCPRDDARIVRKIVQTKWIPVLDKYKVKLPLQCPFHPKRDIFGPQETMKYQHRPSQWTCGFCGKSFFEERFLDKHFDNRHKTHTNKAEDAVCFADYCDIMRCDIINIMELKMISPNEKNTDIEIWREASAYSKALATSETREVAKYIRNNDNLVQLDKISDVKCKKEPSSMSEATNKKSSSTEEDVNHQNNTSSNKFCQSDLVDSALPSPQHKQHQEIQRLKANCKPEELQKLKTKCEILVRDCIASLLIQLTIKDFKEIEDELNRAVCWYLTCDRYWEDFQSEIRSFPWGLICMIIMVLSLGVCLCYYIVWILFDTDDISVRSTSLTDRSTPSPARLLKSEITSGSHHGYSEDYIGSDKPCDYIYVSYPPDLKRRLLESCYNRTTRL